VGLKNKIYMESLKLISSKYFNEYSSKCGVLYMLKKLRSKLEFTSEDFEYYVIASSLYSSKIEGNTLDVNSFFRNRGKRDFPKKKEVQEVEDLVLAYKFAMENELNLSNILKAHQILSKSILPAKERGKVRKGTMSVRDTKTLRPIYIAVEPEYTKIELDKLFYDINILLNSNLTSKEVFYYASMIHLWFVKIHPLNDGNGRTARLIEKWFLVSMSGAELWSINSEKYYWDNRPDYYKNISLGFNYYALYWERCIPFLLMLPAALKESAKKN
jgi:Fic family protein